MPKARSKGKLPIEIVVKADERHHTSVRKPRTHAYRRASEAPMSARAVAVIRPAPSIISLRAFLYILSGKRQLHAYQYRSAGHNLDSFRIAGLNRPISRVEAALERRRRHHFSFSRRCHILPVITSRANCNRHFEYAL